MNAPLPPLERLAGFVDLLRREGFNVGIAESLDAAALAARGDLRDGRALRRGLKALLCSRRREWERFDTLFDAWFRAPGRHAAAGVPGAPATAEGHGAAGVPRGEGGADPDGDEAGAGEGGASPREALGQADFRDLADDTTLRALEELIERLARRLRRRLRRRLERSRQGARLHLRRTIRASLGRGGTPLERVFLRRRRRLPRLVLLVDVSRSMSLYSFLFLRFARGLLGAFAEAEAFVFHTRLVRVSDALRERDLLRAREKLTLLSLGWAGGTRIGECLARFAAEHAGHLPGRRTTVIIVSDGLDTGPPELLADALAALRRRARRLVWLNPLLGRPGYAPLARGMQAALPHLDAFAPAHNLASLAALETVLAP